MTFLYVALYALAITLAALGLLIPAALLAGGAHTLAYRRRLMKMATPIKPVTLRGNG